jgi:hypothetical protein
MSSYCYWKSVFRPDKSGWDLAAEELERGRTCSARGSDMFEKGFWKPARRPDMFGLTG